MEKIIEQSIAFVKETLAEAEGGHDWWHIFRVWQLAKHIQVEENADQLTIELGALFHDIADSKFHDGDETIGPKKAREFLLSIHVNKDTIDHVVNIIENISFKGGNHEQGFRSPELDIVQDADRLDALGAIGIGRAFNYGGHKGRKMYDPNVPPNLNMTKEEYKKNAGPTVNHFYEKLLLLKNRMNTQAGKKIAESRHAFMERFLEEFYKEWNAEL